jgi:hypothetical protein
MSKEVKVTRQNIGMLILKMYIYIQRQKRRHWQCSRQVSAVTCNSFLVLAVQINLGTNTIITNNTHLSTTVTIFTCFTEMRSWSYLKIGKKIF